MTVIHQRARPKLLLVAGARPNFMKVAPLWQALTATGRFQLKLVHTGQHYARTLSSVFLRELALPEPHVNLEVGSAPRAMQLDRVQERFGSYAAEERPDAVIVVGDVNSTLGAARAARQLTIPLFHVEAGLRSGDPRMPEELNRQETDRLSDRLFVTENAGMDNLRREGLLPRAHLVGNVMIDSLVQQLPRARQRRMPERLGLPAGAYWVATFHRPENVDDAVGLKRLVAVLEGLGRSHQVVMPLHPRSRRALEQSGLLPRLLAGPSLSLLPPLGYLDFLSLLLGCRAVLTDSGGVQEETSYLRIPCVTMRRSTERPVTVTRGTNRLAGRDPSAVLSACARALTLDVAACSVPEQWDGRTAPRIADLLCNAFVPERRKEHRRYRSMSAPDAIDLAGKDQSRGT